MRHRYLNPGRMFARHINVESDFFSCAALASTDVIYVRREAISSQSLTIVERGLVAQSGKIGLQVLGEDMILENTRLRKLANAMALTSLVTVSCLERDKLSSLLADFPQARRLVAHARTRIAMQRAVVAVARLVKEAEREARRKGEKDDESISIIEAFNRFASENPPAHSYVVRNKVELRVEELDAKLDEMHAATNAKMHGIDKALQALLGEMRARPASKSPLGAAAKRAEGKRVPKGKSVPPPLPKGSGAAASPPPPPNGKVAAAATPPPLPPGVRPMALGGLSGPSPPPRPSPPAMLTAARPNAPMPPSVPPVRSPLAEVSTLSAPPKAALTQVLAQTVSQLEASLSSRSSPGSLARPADDPLHELACLRSTIDSSAQALHSLLGGLTADEQPPAHAKGAAAAATAAAAAAATAAGAPMASSTPTRAGNESWTAGWMQSFSADQQRVAAAAANTAAPSAAAAAAEQSAAERAGCPLDA